MRSVSIITSLILCICLPAFAQTLSVSVSADPAPLGTPITISVQARVPGLFTTNGCIVGSIRSGTPNGPIVAVFPCIFIPVAIPDCTSTSFRTLVWNQTSTGGSQVAPGLYWFDITFTPGQFGTPAITEWHCLTIHDPANPVPALSAINTPTYGSQFQMMLDAPTHPNAIYAVVLSGSTNVGTSFPGGFACLDTDSLLLATLNPNPAFFVNFFGALDPFGQTNAIAINIPNAPGLGCFPLHAMAAVVTSSGSIALSNDLKFTIE